MACLEVPSEAESLVRKAKAASSFATAVVMMMIVLLDCTSMSTTATSTLAALAKFCQAVLISAWRSSG